MGYSYKNTKIKPVNKNSMQLKEIRKKYIQSLRFVEEIKKMQVYFIDEHVFNVK